MALADAPIATNVVELAGKLRGIVKKSDFISPNVQNAIFVKISLLKSTNTAILAILNYITAEEYL